MTNVPTALAIVLGCWVVVSTALALFLGRIFKR
jgi:hypothetical protein